MYKEVYYIQATLAVSFIILRSYIAIHGIRRGAVATRVALSTCICVFLLVTGVSHEKNGLTDRDAVWAWTRAPKVQCDYGSWIPCGKGHLEVILKHSSTADLNLIC